METLNNPTKTPPEIYHGTITAEEWLNLATLANVASTDHARPLLRTVQIFAGSNPLGKRTLEGVATDSYALAHQIQFSSPNTTWEPAPFLIDIDDLTASAKWVKTAKPQLVTVTQTPTALTFTTSDERTTTYPIQDPTPYPQWRQLLIADSALKQETTFESAEVCNFAPWNFAKMLKLAPWNDKRANATAKLQIVDRNRAAVVTGYAGQLETKFLFMPVRIN